MIMPKAVKLKKYKKNVLLTVGYDVKIMWLQTLCKTRDNYPALVRDFYLHIVNDRPCRHRLNVNIGAVG
jgi:hypothetical protein